MIKYVKGDATKPIREEDEDESFIVHICNDIGGWGSGFVLAINKTFGLAPREAYKDAIEQEHGLGYIQPVLVGGPDGPVVGFEDGTLQCVWVINMIAQHYMGQDQFGEPPIRYGALHCCLEQVRDIIRNKLATKLGANYSPPRKIGVHMPRIGCGLAGGTWQEVEPLIQKTLVAYNIPVTVYDL